MKKQVKLNADLQGHKAGDVIKIEFDGEVPVDRFWRRRWHDSKIDNCIELVKSTKKKVS